MMVLLTPGNAIETKRNIKNTKIKLKIVKNRIAIKGLILKSLKKIKYIIIKIFKKNEALMEPI